MGRGVSKKKKFRGLVHLNKALLCSVLRLQNQKFGENNASESLKKRNRKIFFKGGGVELSHIIYAIIVGVNF